MEIHIQARDTAISDYLRRRASRGIEKLGRRLRATGAVVRFGGDGAGRRVEVELSAPGRTLVGKADGRHFGPALTAALEAVNKQVSHVLGAQHAHVRREAATRRVREA